MDRQGTTQLQSQGGIALVAVLLITVIALGAFVFSAATLSIATRSGAAQERNSTQALLAADSGVSTLRARVNTAGGVQELDEGATVADWINDTFATLDLGNGVSAEIVAAMNGDIIVVGSTGTARGASRTVFQNFVFEEPDWRPLSVNVPGALTSFATIFGRGTATVWGIDDRESDWIFTGKWVPNSAPGLDPVQVPRQLLEASVGEYVQIGTTRYRVEVAATSTTSNATLVPLSGGPAIPEPGGTSVGLIPFALTGEPLDGSQFTVGGVATLPVTEASFTLFDVGYPLKVGEGEGEIVAINFANGTMDVRWTSPPSMGSLVEGDVLRRAVSSGVTNGSCDLGGGPRLDFRDGCDAGEDLSRLFELTFGEGLEPDDIRQRSTVYSSLPSIEGVPLDGWTWVDRSNPDDNLQNFEGQGVLVINNLVTDPVALNVGNTFQGLIYVIGNARLQGNQVSAGAVIVDGTAIIDQEEDLGDTAVAGTTDIRYDPFTLLQAIRSLSQPGDDDSVLVAVPGTWRIR